GSTGGTGKPAVGVAPAGRIVVAWTAPGAPGCGDLVRATVLTPGRAPRAATRISGTCAHAGPVQAVMSHDGTGAVVWRGGATATARRVEVVPVGRTRFGTLRRLGTRPVGADIAVSPARAGALVLWRQTKDASTSPATTYLLAADVTTAGATRPDIFAPAGRIVGVPRVSARRDGSALVTWEEGLPEARVLAADRVPYPTIAFGPPQVVDPCGAVDASRTYATPVLPAGGAAAIVFQSACMARFGLGLDFGIALSRRPADATWQDPQALSQGEYGADARIGASDDGELVLAWLESGVNGGVRVTVVRR
ncbi:MAG: hypothetical protein JWP18_478, partial [Solirubrobacterales bacterium]|nr:hypothetical protein [Solirubrobacterales bacterium]